MKRRFYESTIVLNIHAIHNKNIFSFHTPLDETPGSEPPGVFSFHQLLFVAPVELLLLTEDE